MKIQFASDLHLETKVNSTFIEQYPLEPVGDILVLAGDTMCWNENYQNHPFWDYVSRQYERVIVILGNHEFYKNSDLALLQEQSKHIRENISWYHNEVVSVGDVKLICTTLWSRIPVELEERFHKNTNDFACIKYNGRSLKVEDYNTLNVESVEFIRRELQSGEGGKIVLSHHAPLFDILPGTVNDHWSRWLYANDLKSLIEENPVDYWICGHIHATRELKVGKTKIMANALGYVQKRENQFFDKAKFIEI